MNEEGAGGVIEELIGGRVDDLGDSDIEIISRLMSGRHGDRTPAVVRGGGRQPGDGREALVVVCRPRQVTRAAAQSRWRVVCFAD